MKVKKGRMVYVCENCGYESTIEPQVIQHEIVCKASQAPIDPLEFAAMMNNYKPNRESPDEK